MQIVLLLLLLAISKPFFSQDSLKSYVVFRTKHVIAYLDDKKITPSYDVIYVKKGMHHIKAWAPGYHLLEDSFMVEKNKTLYSKKLHHTGAYRLFVAKRWLKGISTLVLPAITVLYLREANHQVYMNGFLMKRNSNDRNQARARLNYAPGEPTYLSEYLTAHTQYIESYQAYERSKRNRIITVSALGTASLAYFIFTCTHKLKFKEKPLLSRISTGIDPFNNQICLRLKL